MGRSSFLFSDSSFLTGMGRCADLFGEFDRYNRSTNGRVADAIATYNDWASVAEDLIDASREVDAEQLKLFTTPSE